MNGHNVALSSQVNRDRTMKELRHKVIAIAIAIGALLLVLSVNQVAACGMGNIREAWDGMWQSYVPLSSFSIKTPVFMFDLRGRLLRGNLTTGEWQLISDHGFDSMPTIAVSADARWISYAGNLKGWKVAQYWLYDTRTGSDRLYHQHPAWGGGSPQFSPDGKAITFFANYDSRWPSAAGAGLYIVDTETAHSVLLGNPSKVATPANNGFATVTWSGDGKELLLMMRSLRAEFKDTREYYSYRLTKRRHERISGQYEKVDGPLPGDKFFRAGGVIAEYRQYSDQAAYLRALASPDGQWHASIDQSSYVLTVKSNDGVGKKVAVGGYDFCTGEHMGIHGWIDGRYLVYSLRRVTYVYDPVSERKAAMFPEQFEPMDFLW